MDKRRANFSVASLSLCFALQRISVIIVGGVFLFLLSFIVSFSGNLKIVL